MLRARMFDRYVEEFLAAHPGGTVVEIGCGLDTRFDRVDNGRVFWFDLDLPDTIVPRRRFFENEPRRTMTATSVLAEAWMDADRDLLDRLPLPLRLTARFAPFLLRRQAALYRLNLATAEHA